MTVNAGLFRIHQSGLWILLLSLNVCVALDMPVKLSELIFLTYKVSCSFFPAATMMI